MKKEDAVMENKNRLFRKAKFGGFNKEDVMQYIETMKKDFFDYKAQVEETISELNERLAAFEDGGEASVEKATAFADDNALSINKATEHLKEVADELCDKMNRLIGRMQGDERSEPVEPAAQETAEPQAPATPQDKVESLLSGLFTGGNAPAPSAAPKAIELSDVFPAYTKQD